MKECGNNPQPDSEGKRTRIKFQSCIRSEDPVETTGSGLTKEEGVFSEPVITEEERKAFENLAASLVQRGAIIQTIPSESQESASYTPGTDIIRVHDRDFFDLYQEAIHRVQTRVASKFGFQSIPYIERPLHFAAEVGAISLGLRLSEKELAKAQNKIDITGGTVEDDIKSIRLSGQIANCHLRLLDFQTALYSELKKLNPEQFKRYEHLFIHPLFLGAEDVARWVRFGLKPPKTVTPFDPPDSKDPLTCFRLGKFE